MQKQRHGDTATRRHGDIPASPPPRVSPVARFLDFLCGARPPRRRVPAPPRRTNEMIAPCSSAGCSPQAACPKCPIYHMARNEKQHHVIVGLDPAHGSDRSVSFEIRNPKSEIRHS